MVRASVGPASSAKVCQGNFASTVISFYLAIQHSLCNHEALV